MSDLTPSPWRVRASLRALSVYRSYTPPSQPDPIAAADESTPAEKPLVKGANLDPAPWIVVACCACIVIGWCIGMLLRGVLL